MNLRSLFCVLALLAFEVPTLLGALPPDAEATSKLIGEWTITGGENQVVSKGDFVFKGDGTFSSTVDVTTPKSAFHVELEGKWNVKDGILTEEITKSSDPKRVAAGSVTKDTLVEVTDKGFQSRTEQGRVESYVRR